MVLLEMGKQMKRKHLRQAIGKGRVIVRVPNGIYLLKD